MPIDQRTHLEIADELYEFLLGRPPKGVTTGPLSRRKGGGLTTKQAFRVIWFLQEVSRLIDSSIEQCSNCENLFDSSREGFNEESGKFYCDFCTSFSVELKRREKEEARHVD